MKRMAFIAVVLCALLLTTVGAGVVLAKQDGSTPQKGISPIYQFDVTLVGGDKVIGKLVINAKTNTFVFNGKGLEVGEEYFLVCTDLMRSIGSAKAAAGGTVQIRGACDAWTPVLASNPKFELSTSPPVGIGCIPTTLTAEYTNAFFVTTMAGWLKWGQGAPLTDQTIEIRQFDEKTWSTKLVGTTTTDWDGHYLYSKAFWFPPRPVFVWYLGADGFCPAYAQA